jgi:hypothetical protein
MVHDKLYDYMLQHDQSRFHIEISNGYRAGRKVIARYGECFVNRWATILVRSFVFRRNRFHRGINVFVTSQGL